MADIAAKSAAAIGEVNRFRSYSLLRVSEAQARVHQFAEAIETAKAITHDNRRIHALSSVVRTQVSVGQSEEAVKSATAINHADDRTRMLLSVASELDKKGRGGKAEVTARAAAESAIAIDDIEARAKALVEIVLLMVKVGLLDEAQTTAQMAVKAAMGIENGGEKIKILAEIASVLFKAGALQQGRATIDMAAEAAKTFRKYDNWYWGALKWFEMVDSVLRTQVKAGLIVQAVNTAQAIEDAKSRSGFLRVIAVELAEAGQLTRAGEIAKRIDDETQRTYTLASLASALAEAGKADEAQATADLATESVKSIFHPTSRAVTLAELASALAKIGSVKDARAMVDMAIEIAMSFDEGVDKYFFEEEAPVRNSPYSRLNDHPSPESRRGLLNSIALELARGGQFVEAVKTVQLIDDVIERANGLIEIANTQVDFGRVRAARRTLRHALVATKSLATDHRHTSDLQELLQSILEVVAENHLLSEMP